MHLVEGRSEPRVSDRNTVTVEEVVIMWSSRLELFAAL